MSVLQQLSIWTLPIVGAFNGWITTYLAIRMLFRPRSPVRIFGIPYQAPLPKRQHEIAQRLGAVIEGQLLNYDDIKARVVTPGFISRIHLEVEIHIGRMLAERRAQLPSIAQALITDDLLRRAQKMLADEVQGQLPGMIEAVFGHLTENVQIRELVAEKVAGFEISEMEDVIFSLAAKELRLIELLCALLGLLIGVCQMLLVLW